MFTPGSGNGRVGGSSLGLIPPPPPPAFTMGLEGGAAQHEADATAAGAPHHDDGGLSVQFLPLITITSADGRLELQQFLTGDGWSKIAYNPTGTPELGQALMARTPVSMQSRYYPDASGTRAIQLCVENQVRIPVLRGLHDAGMSDAMVPLMLHVHSSHPEKWPREWACTQPPDMYVIVRIHVGFASDTVATLLDSRQTPMQILHQLAIGREVLNKLYPIANHQLVAARAIFGVFDAPRSRYVRAESEEVTINSLHQLAMRTPSLFEGRYQPLATSGGGSAGPRSDRNHERASEYNLKKAPLVQMRALDLFKGWPKSETVQLWMLGIVRTFLHGYARTLVPELVRFGKSVGMHELYDALKTMAMESVMERFPVLSDLYAQPAHRILLRKVVAAAADMLEQPVTSGPADGVLSGRSQLDDNIATTFAEGVSNILLALRAIPYSADVATMAQQELRRLATIARPEGLSDAQWWSLAIRRYRNWMVLLGRRVFSDAGGELKDFLPHIAGQLKDRPSLNLLLEHANSYTQQVLNSWQLTPQSVFGQDIALTRHAPVLPARRDQGALERVAPGRLYEQVTDLRKIFDLGEGLRRLGEPTDGTDTTVLFLEYTALTVGETGVGQVLSSTASTGGDSQVLTVNPVLLNDTFHDTEPWPVLPCIAVVVPGLNAGPAAPPEATPRTLHVAGSEGDGVRKLVAEAVTDAMVPVNDRLAHLAALSRAQFDQLASADMSKATPGTGASAAAIKQVDVHAHAQDKARKNLGGRSGPPGQQGPRRTPGHVIDGLKYMTKPPIAWKQIDSTVQQHLENAFGINEHNWEIEGKQLCKICADKDHLLNRCLLVWASSREGQAFLGVDKAAQKVRKLMQGAGHKIASLDEIMQLYMGDGDTPDAGFDAIVEQSPLLCMVCRGDVAVAPETLAAEFDDARERVVSAMQDAPAVMAALVGE